MMFVICLEEDLMKLNSFGLKLYIRRMENYQK